jgi:hypothetical protein
MFERTPSQYLPVEHATLYSLKQGSSTILGTKSDKSHIKQWSVIAIPIYSVKFKEADRF